MQSLNQMCITLKCALKETRNLQTHWRVPAGLYSGCSASSTVWMSALGVAGLGTDGVALLPTESLGREAPCYRV